MPSFGFNKLVSSVPKVFFPLFCPSGCLSSYSLLFTPSVLWISRVLIQCFISKCSLLISINVKDSYAAIHNFIQVWMFSLGSGSQSHLLLDQEGSLDFYSCFCSFNGKVGNSISLMSIGTLVCSLISFLSPNGFVLVYCWKVKFLDLVVLVLLLLILSILEFQISLLKKYG